MQTKLLLRILILSFNFVANKIVAQNLVPNYSFEDTIECPFGSGQIYYAHLWFQPNIIGSSTDYYNKCSTYNVSVPKNYNGYQNAKTGNAYAGIELVYTNDYREYIEIRLLDSLIAGQKYCVNFYVSLANISDYATSSVGAYLSKDSILYTPPPYILSVSPQVKNSTTNILRDTLNWMLVSDSMIANGGEKFITIGNFYSDTNSVLVNVAGGDGGGDCYYYIDDITVEACNGLGVGEIDDGDKIKVYPNPAATCLTLTLSPFGFAQGKLGEGTAIVSLFDVLGEEVKQLNFATDNIKINISDLNEGMYFIQLKTNEHVYTQKIIIQR